MRNHELIKEIYEICQTADYRDEGHVVPEIIFNLIEKERPELTKDSFMPVDWVWKGGHMVAPTGCDYGIGG